MQIRIPVALLLAVLSAAIGAAQQAPPPQEAPPAQEPPPVTFRVEVNYVEVDAVVTDAQGRVVTDLAQPWGEAATCTSWWMAPPRMAAAM